MFLFTLRDTLKDYIIMDDTPVIHANKASLLHIDLFVVPNLILCVYEPYILRLQHILKLQDSTICHVMVGDY